MKDKKIIERNLPLNETYQFVSVTRGSIESGQVTSCDNCGQLITNIVTVINSRGKQYMIGTDCSETLLKANAIKMLKGEDYQVEMYTLRKVNRFMTNATKPDTKTESDGIYVMIEYMTSKGPKRESEFMSTIRKFYPNYLRNEEATK